MKRMHGTSLPGCLLGLGLGLLVLQALLDVVASAHQALQTQRLALRRQESEGVAGQMLRTVAEASRRQALRAAGPDAGVDAGVDARGDALAAHPGAQGEALEARFIADGAPGACGEAAPAAGTEHRYRLDIDGAGTLRCAMDGHAPQPLADGLGAWELEFVEWRGEACTPGAGPCRPLLRRVHATGVRDWSRVVLVRARPRSHMPGLPAATPPALPSWVALPLLGGELP